MINLTRYIKFPLTFDVSRLQQDVKSIISHDWVEHYNTGGYSGKWNSLALMSPNGLSDAIYAMTDEKLKATEILACCPYLNEILDGFLFEKTAVRLLQLEAGAEVKPHTDNELGYEDGCFRLHIPIITNKDVAFILDGERIVMNEGECWYIDANFTHSVANKGTRSRIHLVIDGLRNEWTDEMFYKEAAPEAFIRPPKIWNDEERARMIAELEKMDTDVARELLKEMR